VRNARIRQGSAQSPPFVGRMPPILTTMTFA
jgi:hypothetical protein